MKVLIDECSPKALKRHLADRGHECVTVQQAGWAGKKNGELLDLAEPLFDVLVTLDTNVQYQQNLAGRKLAVVVFHSSSNRLEHLRQYFPECVSAIQKIKPGQVVRVGSLP
jgi:predicted nuclease of predicted toxin-antitoxin system